MRARLPGFLIFVLLLIVPLALAQDSGGVIAPADDMMVDANAHISFPPPVYVVRDSIDIRGTVDLPNILSFFIEFRPLVLDADDQEASLWFPATLPQRSAVVDDILGTWNTRTARDGLYELRLNINTGDGPQFTRLSPIRVENNPPPFAEAMPAPAAEAPPAPEPAPEPAEATMDEPAEDSMAESMDEPADDSPRVVALVNSNVRAGDSTSYQIVGFLLEGSSAQIRGISSRGTSWYVIELANGTTGFIHPNIVRAEGDVSDLRRITPPPLPPTPIPLPTAIPVVAPAEPAAPASGANLVFGEIRMEPHPATCNETYTIHVTVQNVGNGDAGGFAVQVRDSRMGTGEGQATTLVGFPPIPAGQSSSAFGRITQNQYVEEVHHVNLQLDINNQVAESNEGDNFGATAAYILGRGGC